MCEINPKHSAYFRLEAFTSNPEMSADEFMQEVMTRLLQAEMQLNADGRFRFHIHALEPFEEDALPEDELDLQVQRFFEEDR